MQNRKQAIIARVQFRLILDDDLFSTLHLRMPNRTRTTNTDALLVDDDLLPIVQERFLTWNEVVSSQTVGLPPRGWSVVTECIYHHRVVARVLSRAPFYYTTRIKMLRNHIRTRRKTRTAKEELPVKIS